MAKATNKTKKPAPKKQKPASSKTGKGINNVKVRMYCLGTGDCFVLQFCHDDVVEFKMMIDCGSCQGGPDDFKPYIEDLAVHVGKHLDLLVITHEHNDHVNGFAKCAGLFNEFKIDEAWFAWTENPEDPGGVAKELQKKRSKMKLAFSKAIDAIRKNDKSLEKNIGKEFYARAIHESNAAMLKGLDTLAEINLPASSAAGNPLPGMLKIKEILKSKKVKTKYLNPGETIKIAGARNVKFHVLGPPLEREYVFKDGKEGVDVYNKKLSLNESSLAANALLNQDGVLLSDLPFSQHYMVDEATSQDASHQQMVKEYKRAEESWRKIDHDWLNSAGSLALRLNSHINNTSLVLAIEFDSKKVMLFPGDAEYGSWASWHEIRKWQPDDEGGKHFVEDLLNRTVFYKVGHHLSYNGTALQKGIMMMEDNDLAAMATLDRHRISQGWKSTMPNKHLMKELIRRCQGRVFIMDEFEIKNGPSKTLNPLSLKNAYQIKYFEGTKDVIYIQYTCRVE